MLDFTKTFINAIKHYIDSKKLSDFENDLPNSDWNQNDPEAPDYVKNRTHWEEEDVVELIPEMKVSITEEDGYIELGYFTQLVVGQTYLVTLNGIEYKCVGREWNEENCVLIGNGTIYGDGDISNNEPFSCDSYDRGLIYLNTTPGEHTFSLAIYNQTVHTLDKKYLPDDIGGKPDWNQDDPEAPDYIKNKPFYEEFEYIPYIPTQTITLLPPYETSESVYCSVPGVYMPWDFLPYRITFDGVEYETMMIDYADYACMEITLADDSNVRLRVLHYGSIAVSSRDYAGEHTITVEQIKNTVHILDSKYLGFPLFAGTGENAICMNDTNNEASGQMALAEGRETVASDFCAHAEGWHTTASGYSSHAEGEHTTASSNSSHAEGNGTTASGSPSHAEGYYTTASGDYGAHAEGGYTTASGNYSHAEGQGTIAIGRSQNVIGEYNSVNTLDKYRSVVDQMSTLHFHQSITLYVSTEYIFDSTTGRYTLVTPTTCTGTNLKSTISSMPANIYLSTSESSDTMYRIVKGSSRPHGNISGNNVYIYNPDIYTREPVSTFRDKYAHIVGNGTGIADNQRSNAHTLDWEGNAWFAGKVFVGGTGQDDPNAVELGTGNSSGGNPGILVVKDIGNNTSSHSAEEIYQAKQNGQNVIFVFRDNVYYLSYVEIEPSYHATFFNIYGSNMQFVYIDGNDITSRSIDINTNSGVSSWNDLTDKPFGEDEEGNVQYIDEKFIPDSIARTSYDNLVTESKELVGAINELNTKFADIESICDEVIALQNSYINGVKVIQEGDTLIIQNGGDADA